MEEKSNLIYQLIQLAKADGEIKEAEYILLESMAKLLKLSPSIIDELMNSNIEIKMPANEFDRILQFHRLVLLANVDLEVSLEENNLLIKSGFILGLNPDAINEVLEEMKKYNKGLIPTEKLIDIFKVYHN